MKILISILLCVTLISCEQYSAPNEVQPVNALHLLNESNQQSDTNFTVANLTHVNIGWISGHLVDNSNVNLNVPDSGTYSVQISSDLAFCNIGGQIVANDTTLWIRIDEHIRVHALRTSNVVVIDQSEVN
jgi:hypothetical protein